MTAAAAPVEADGILGGRAFIGTISTSVSLKSFRITLMLSNESSPWTGALLDLGIAGFPSAGLRLSSHTIGFNFCNQPPTTLGTPSGSWLSAAGLMDVAVSVCASNTGR